MKFFLIVAKGKKQGMPIPIEIDLFLIGSGTVCQLRAEHESIGEQHCALVTRGRKVFITDLDSGQPTFVNGELLAPGIEWPLHPLDILEIGPLKFMVQYREKPLSQRDLEEWALKCLDQNSGRKKELIRQEDEFHSKQFEAASNAAAAILDGLNAQRGEVKGHLRVSREGMITLVRVNHVYLVEPSELALVKHELYEQLDHTNLRVLMDMKNVKRMSSQAAEMFAALRIWLRPKGSRMAFCRLRPEFESMFKGYQVTRDMPMFREKPKALEAKW